jgi:hypothetical protein
MEAWRQWLLGERKNNVSRSQSKMDLTPTGLLMEALSQLHLFEPFLLSRFINNWPFRARAAWQDIRMDVISGH